MDDYWMSSKSNPKMFRPERLTKEVEDYLRENHGVDVHQLAMTLGIPVRTVRAYQIFLGLRQPENNR